MNRRKFLKVSALTSAGVLVPLTFVPNLDEAKLSEFVHTDFLYLKIITSRGNLNFKVPAERKVINFAIVWESTEDFVFEVTETTTILGMKIFSPITRAWIDTKTNMDNFPISSGDTVIVDRFIKLNHTYT